MINLLFTGAILSWIVGALMLVGAGSMAGQIIGAIAILNGTAALVGGLILQALDDRAKS